MATKKLLDRTFFKQATVTVAKGLLGKYLVRDVGEHKLTGKIVETEAYLYNDPAAHSCRGKTPRNKAMFGPPGHAYVYLIYGIYYCMNCTTNEVGVGEAVLIRALEPVTGIEQMRQFRGKENLHALCSGPGKLTQAMAISKEQYGVDLTSSGSPIRIEQSHRDQEYTIASSPRIGITKGTDDHLRFYLAASEFVSQ